MSAQDRTLDQYHEWMQVNAVSHLIRAAREVGILDTLRDGQKSGEGICQSLSLEPRTTALLLDALVAIGIVEKYGEDYALARAAHLLCQYDDDLGDCRWSRIAKSLRGDAKTSNPKDEEYFDHNAATQWIHTPAAIQAAEMLNVGGDGLVGPSILDLGCGSAVWSCAMAHRDKTATVTAVDHLGALVAAQSTADSIDLGERFTTIAGDPAEVDLPPNYFDLVVIAQRLHALGHSESQSLLGRAIGAAKPAGHVVVIDLFRGPAKANLAEAVEAIKLELDTQSGRMRTLEESEAAFHDAGLQEIQFSFLAASQMNLGLMVAEKPM